MATKVFYRCIKTGSCSQFTVGKEYECKENYFVVDDRGYSVRLGPSCRAFYFGHELERIERQTFEAHNLTWFRHVPGEPIPCDKNATVRVLMDVDDGKTAASNIDDAAGCLNWDRGTPIIGWRYADSEQKEPEVQHVQIVGSPEAVSAGVIDEWIHIPSGHAVIVPEGVPYVILGGNDDSVRNDLVAAVDDGHLTPEQKAYINAKEEKVAERLRSEAAKEELKRADHSKSIQDLANANGAVKFEHDHRLGWMA